MDMKCTMLSTQNQFSLNGECPHCQKPTVFTMATPAHEQPSGSGQSVLYAVMRCSGCLQYILGIVLKQAAGPWFYRGHYPLGSPKIDLSQDIPDPIRSDFIEAIKCRWVKADKAAVTMCRRAIESACENLGAKAKENIRAKIDELFKAGTITSPLQQMAHRVRLEARVAAHPQEDGLDEITDEDADAIIEFTQEFFDHVYVMPAKLKRAVERAEQRKSPPAAAAGRKA
jgi:hypothetical protein